MESTISIRGEARFDRSTGPDGGFFKGADNELVPNQGLFILAINWLLGSGLRHLAVNRDRLLSGEA